MSELQFAYNVEKIEVIKVCTKTVQGERVDFWTVDGKVILSINDLLCYADNKSNRCYYETTNTQSSSNE